MTKTERKPSGLTLKHKIGYGLGPMGFLCFPELKEEAGDTGNYGLYDRINAIKEFRRVSPEALFREWKKIKADCYHSYK